MDGGNGESVTKLIEMEKVDPVLIEKLRRIGIISVEGLLRAGATRADRLSICVRSATTRGTVDALVQEADLIRITGVGPAFAHLLRRAGVHSVGELALADTTTLVDALFEANLVLELLAHLPSDRQVSAWIWQAKKLDPVLEV